MVNQLAIKSYKKVYACNQSSDDFLIWRDTMKGGINYETLKNYSLFNIRETLSISTIYSGFSNQKSSLSIVNLLYMQHVVKRYQLLYNWQLYNDYKSYILESESFTSYDKPGSAVITNNNDKNNSNEPISFSLNTIIPPINSVSSHGFITPLSFSSALLIDSLSAEKVFEVFYE